MTNTISVSEVREDYNKAPQFSADGTHEAYIAKIYTSGRAYTIGVNYWTPEEAAKGAKYVNGIFTEVVEKLYK